MLSVILFAAALMQPEPDLLAKSTMLLKPGHWYEYAEGVPQYTWVNLHEILYSIGRGISNPYHEYPWFSIDLRTQKSRQMMGVAKASSKFREFRDPLPNQQGTRLLWETCDAHWTAMWTLTKSDGTMIANWPRRAFNMMPSSIGLPQSWDEWSLDGRSIFESEAHPQEMTGLHIWRRDLSNLSKEIKLPTLPIACEPGDWTVVFDLGNGNAVWINRDWRNPIQSQPVIQWPIAKPESRQEFSLPIPKSWASWGPVVSPDHQRVLWEVWGQDHLTAGIWVSSIDCSGLHEIGVVHIDPKLRAVGMPGFGEVHWIPGRAAASFCFAGKIYEVGVD